MSNTFKVKDGYMWSVNNLLMSKHDGFICKSYNSDCVIWGSQNTNR